MDEQKTELILKPRTAPDSGVLQYQLAMPIAKRFAKEIGEVCNKKFKGGAHMACTVGAFVFRTMLVNTTRQLYKAGSQEGIDFITNVYESAKKDALADWTTEG